MKTAKNAKVSECSLMNSLLESPFCCYFTLFSYLQLDNMQDFFLKLRLTKFRSCLKKRKNYWILVDISELKHRNEPIQHKKIRVKISIY